MLPAAWAGPTGCVPPFAPLYCCVCIALVAFTAWLSGGEGGLLRFGLSGGPGACACACACLCVPSWPVPAPFGPCRFPLVYFAATGNLCISRAAPGLSVCCSHTTFLPPTLPAIPQLHSLSLFRQARRGIVGIFVGEATLVLSPRFAGRSAVPWSVSIIVGRPRSSLRGRSSPSPPGVAAPQAQGFGVLRAHAPILPAPSACTIGACCPIPAYPRVRFAIMALGCLGVRRACIVCVHSESSARVACP